VWPNSQPEAGLFLECSRIAIDGVDNGHFAMATVESFIFKRDPVGAAPLYFSYTADGSLSFASEVKALMEAISGVNELPPGHIFDGAQLYHYEPIAA
jgi:asparagine synthase (glutamine-hydrolysing)